MKYRCNYMLLLVLIFINFAIKLFTGYTPVNSLIAYIVRVAFFTVVTTLIVSIVRKRKLYTYVNEDNLLYVLAAFTLFIFVLMRCYFKYMLLDVLFVLYTATLLKKSIVYVKSNGLTSSWLIVLLNVFVYIMYLYNDFGATPASLLMYFLFTLVSFMNAMDTELTVKSIIKLVLFSLILTIIATFILYGKDYVQYKVLMVVSPDQGSELSVVKALFQNAKLIGANTYQSEELCDYIVHHLPKYWILYKFGIIPFVSYIGLLTVYVFSGTKLLKNQHSLVFTLILYQIFSVIISSISVIGDHSLSGFGVLISVVLLVFMMFTNKKESDVYD